MKIPLFIAALALSSLSLTAEERPIEKTQFSLQLGPDYGDDGYYYYDDDDYDWIGPGWYGGYWYDDEDNWRGGHGDHWHGHDHGGGGHNHGGGGHSHGGGGHGGGGHGGGGHGGGRK